MNDKIVDRFEETKELKTYLNDNLNGNAVIFVYGAKDVGKSTVIKRAIEISQFNANKIINIDAGSNIHSREFSFLHLLYKELESKIGIVSMISANGLNEVTNFIKTISGWLKNIVKVLLKYPNKGGTIEYNGQTLERIENVLNEGNYYITFHNFQNADEESKKCIYNIINNCHGNKIIFEVIADSKDYAIQQIVDINKKSGLDYSNEEQIEKLKFSSLEKFLDFSHFDEVEKKNLEKAYNASSGSIFAFKHIYKIKSRNENEYYDFEDLKVPEIFIIFTIYAHQNMLMKDELFKFVNTSNPINENYPLGGFINTLKENGFIEFMPGALLTQKSKKGIIEAKELHYNIYTIVLQTINKYYIKNESPNAYLNRLYATTQLLDTTEILFLLKNLHEHLHKCNNPYKEFLVIDSFIDYYMEKNSQNADNEKIASYMCNAGLYIRDADYSAKYLHMMKNDELYKLFHAFYLSLLDDNDIPKRIKKLMNESTLTKNTIFIMNILILVWKMEHSFDCDIKKEFETLQNKENEAFSEYCYLERDYAETLTIDEGINQYEKCLKNYYPKNDKLYRLSVSNLLAMNYAHKGDLKKALDVLSTTKNTHTHRYYYLNNNSAIRLLNGDLSTEIIKDLEFAEILDNDDYELMIIRCNMMIYYLLTNDYPKAIAIVGKLSESEESTYKYCEYRHILYTNLLYYYECVDDAKQQLHYVNLLKKLEKEKNTNSYTKELIQARLQQISSNHFFSKLPYRIDFIGDWDFPIEIERYL